MPFFVIVLTCSVNAIYFSLYVCVSVKTSLSKILLMTTSLELWGYFFVYVYMYLYNLQPNQGYCSCLFLINCCF